MISITKFFLLAALLLTGFEFALAADIIPQEGSLGFDPSTYVEFSENPHNSTRAPSRTRLSKREAAPSRGKRPRASRTPDYEDERERQRQRTEEATARVRRREGPALWYNRPLLSNREWVPDILPRDGGRTVEVLFNLLQLRLSEHGFLGANRFNVDRVDAIEYNGYAMTWQWVNENELPWPRYTGPGGPWQPPVGPDMPLPLDTQVMQNTPGDLGTAPPNPSEGPGAPPRPYTLSTWLRRLLDLERPAGGARTHDPSWSGTLVFARGNFAFHYLIMRLLDPRLVRLVERTPAYGLIFPSYRRAVGGNTRYGVAHEEPPGRGTNGSGNPPPPQQKQASGPDQQRNGTDAAFNDLGILVLKNPDEEEAVRMLNATLKVASADAGTSNDNNNNNNNNGTDSQGGGGGGAKRDGGEVVTAREERRDLVPRDAVVTGILSALFVVAAVFLRMKNGLF